MKGGIQILLLTEGGRRGAEIHALFEKKGRGPSTARKDE
jgi:hypothetical protein